MAQDKLIKPTTQAPKAKSKKRARDDGSNNEAGSKKRRRNPAFEQDDLDLDLEAGLNKKIALLDNMLLADHIAQKTRRFGTDLKPMELAALDISPNAIKDSSSFPSPRNLENLPSFLETHAKNPEELAGAPKANGSPHTIIVAGAGLRAADLVRAVRKYQSKQVTVGKLVQNPISLILSAQSHKPAHTHQFAKHIKIEDTKKFLETHRTGVAVGTPVRLSDLLETGALKIDKLERLVVDASHIDQKKRGIMDMKETMIPLARWICRAEFKERYTDPERPLQLLFY